MLLGTGDKVIYSVPYVGYILNFGRSTPGHILLLGAPLVLLAAVSLYEKWQLPRGRQQPESLQSSAETPGALRHLTLVPRRPTFLPAGKPIHVSLVDLSDLRGLMDAARTLSDFPAAKHASITAFMSGTALLEVALRVPVTADEIADELQGGTGYHILIEEVRPDIPHLRLRFVDASAYGQLARAA